MIQPFDEQRVVGQAIVRNLLDWFSHCGVDSKDEGLDDTPRRVIAAWREMLGGYQDDPEKLLGVTFEADCDEMVTLSGIPFFSTCEHHLLPFAGTATVSYLPTPGGRVVGISKLARLVDCYAKRLQIQERMTTQIADALMKHLSPRGVGVVVQASHLCMVCRGVQKPGALMRTTALRGLFREDDAARAEFLGGVHD